MKHSRQASYIDRSNIRTRPVANRAPQRGGSVNGFKQTVRERPARMARPEQPDRQKIQRPDSGKRQARHQKPHSVVDTPQKSPQNEAAAVAKRHAKKSNVLQRNLVQKPQQTTDRSQLVKNKPKRSLAQKLHRRPRYAFVLAGLVILFGAIGVLTAFYLSGPRSSADEAQVLSNQSGGVRDRPEQLQMEFVDETPRDSSDFEDYRVDEEAPRLLRIDSIDTTALIKPVQVDMANRLITPDNIFDVGWYEGSRQPGRSGVVVLNGHVAGANSRGALYYARALEPGDIIELERGDGEVFSYEIKEKQKIAYKDIQTTDLLIPHEPGTNGLNIVAVDNRYNVLTDEFQDRLVLYAVQR